MNRKALFYGLIPIFLWSTTFSLSKIILHNPNGTQRFGVFSLLAIRLIFGLSFLWIFMIKSKKIKLVPEIYKNNKKELYILGLFSFGMAYVIQYCGLYFTTSVNNSIILQIQAFFVILFSFILYKNKIRPSIYLGCIIAFIGFLFIVIKEDFSIGTDTIFGDILTFISTIFWGSFTAISGEVITKKNDRLTVLVIIETIASMVIVPMAFMDPYNDLNILTLVDWLIILWLGVVCLGITYLLYFTALSHASSQEVILLNFLMPIFSSILGFFLLGEKITLNMIIGTFFILFGVYIAENMKIAERKKKSKKKEENTKNKEIINY